MEFIEWVTPYGPNWEPAYMRVTKATAVAVSHHIAKANGHVYKSDVDALEDFMIVHWAYIVSEPEVLLEDKLTDVRRTTEVPD